METLGPSSFTTSLMTDAVTK